MIARYVFVTALALGACKQTAPVDAASSSVPDAVASDAAGAAPDAAAADAAVPDAAAADAAAPDAAPDATASLDRKTRPAPRPIAELKLPKAETFTLSNGLEVYLLGGATLPTVTMTFEFDTGAVNDPPDRVGLASVCLDLFSESTARLDKIAWSEALADHAVSIFSPAGAETSTIGVTALSRELGPALDLFSELITSPGMRKEDFERIIADRKAAIAQSCGSPSGVGARVFASLVWGKEHPFGAVQTEKQLDAIKLADCKAWVGQLKPRGARLWVAGKVSKDELVAALEPRLATWTGDAPKPATYPAAPKPDGTIYSVQLDGAVQSMVLVGYPGPERTAADYEATFLMAQIFGGSFSSRINMNLREAKGYAYGSSGRYAYRRVGSAFTVSASVEATTTVLSLREIASELGKMRAEPVTTQELAREREGALLALPARFADPADTLDELRTLRFYGLPLDWFEGYQQRLKAVEPPAVFEASKAHLMPDGAVVLVVGDFTQPAKDADGKTLLDELKKLADEHLFGPGGLILLDVDGRPRKP